MKGFEGDQGTAGVSRKANKEILEHDRDKNKRKITKFIHPSSSLFFGRGISSSFPFHHKFSFLHQIDPLEACWNHGSSRIIIPKLGQAREQSKRVLGLEKERSS
ncbi:unnamed protein product [Trifolium pratense]|uniref:Uncharacterized protein n=1 Tax=Trifolium pratense TaxID=57577 RepID=A0ACB0K3R8_TRIPR|nr:unnamed protein product [Trifolium pratense]